MQGGGVRLHNHYLIMEYNFTIESLKITAEVLMVTSGNNTEPKISKVFYLN